MRLNEPASAFRSASSPASTLVPSSPPAMATAASEIPDSGRRTRPLAHRPTTAPAMVVTRAAAPRARVRVLRVPASSSREKTSK